MIFADKVFLSGKIDTQDRLVPTATAFAIRDERFIMVGADEEVRDYIGEETEIIMLENKRVVPGFNDSHMHYLGYCLDKSNADLRGTKSIKEIQNILSTHNPKGEWIIGSGWNDTLFEDKVLPTRFDLDKVYSNRPIMLSRICYHICVVNSKALELAGINKETKDPAGGKIDRDENTGIPTGILRENAVNLVYDKISKLNCKEVIKELILTGVEDALRVGLTSIQTDDFESCDDFVKVVEAYTELSQEKRLPIRINLQMRASNKNRIGQFISRGLITGKGDDKVKVGPVKLMADGSLGSRTAAMINPYNDMPNTKGILIHSPVELKSLVDYCDDNNLQVAIHAIGDRTMEEILNIYKDLSPKKRHRIIHCQITNLELIDQFKDYGVLADIQPIFVSSDYKIVEERVGEEYARGTYNWKTMLEKGIKVGAGSDSPIEDFNPILGIYAAVTRQDLEGNPKGGWFKDQCLNIKDAIKIFTMGSAYATSEEELKGSITKGKLADFLILSDDIFEIDKSKIKDVRVEATYIGGERFY